MKKIAQSLMYKGFARVPFAPVNPSVVSSSLTGAAIFVVRKSYKT